MKRASLTLAVLILIICSLAGSAAESVVFNPDKSENFDDCMKSSSCLEGMRNWYSTGKQSVGLKPKLDDKYFAQTVNVKASLEAAKAYFGKKENVDKMMKTNPAAADEFFKDPVNVKGMEDINAADSYFAKKGNLGKNPESSHEYFSKKYGTDVTIPSGSTASYDPKTNSLINKGALDLSTFKGERISPLKDGGYDISGNKYSEFTKISHMPDGRVRMDDMISDAEGKGNEFNPRKSHLESGTTLSSAEMKNVMGKTVPEWSVKADKSLDTYFDETKVTGMKNAAISVTKGGVLANRYAEAVITNGPLRAVVSEGSIEYAPLDDATIQAWKADPAFSKGVGYHLGVESSMPGLNDGASVDRVDLNPNPNLGVKEGLKYTKGNMMRGAEVTNLQKALNQLGVKDANGNVLETDTGKFGPRTDEALKTFQSSAGLSPTGLLDKATIDSLSKKTADIQELSQDRGTLTGFQTGSIYQKKSLPTGTQGELGSWPTGMGEWQSGWGASRVSGGHRGYDFGVPKGTPVSTMPGWGDGVMTYKGWQSVHGFVAEVYYPNMQYPTEDGMKTGVTVRYSHLREMPVQDMGYTYSEGETVAYSGRTGGRANGEPVGYGVEGPNNDPHLHLEIKPGVKAEQGQRLPSSYSVNPIEFMRKVNSRGY